MNDSTLCTWNVTPLVPQALNYLWNVLVVSGLGQSEDDLHEVPVHQTAVCTLCCIQSLTEIKERGEEDRGEEERKERVSFWRKEKSKEGKRKIEMRKRGSVQEEQRELREGSRQGGRRSNLKR